MSTRNLISLFIVVSILLTGCGGAASPTNPVNPSRSTTPSQPVVTDTPAPPTPTPAPLAARVNADGILLADFEAELQRVKDGLTAAGQQLPADDQLRKLALDNLIDETLLAQVAAEAGHTIDDASLQARLVSLTAQAGGGQAVADWIKKNGYTDESFQRALRRSMAAAWQRDQVIASVPASVEQIHARQILAYDETKANSAYQSLQNGADFATIALRYDPITGGDLGWFPRGYLILAEVEAAVFALQPGQYTQVLKTAYGYQIIQVIERGDHPLSGDARQTLQRQAIQKWLADRRGQAKIEILTP
jgi:peptidyl-prolyl cis-trans isomerase C